MKALNGEDVQGTDLGGDVMGRLLKFTVYIFLKVTEPKILC